MGVINGVDENDGVTKLKDSAGRKDEGKDKEEEEVESDGSEQEVAAAVAVAVAVEEVEEEEGEEVGQFSNLSNEDKKST